MRRLDRQWVELLLLTLTAVLLFQSGIMLFLFCVPLQVLFIRQGRTRFLLACLLFLCVIAAWGLVAAAAAKSPSGLAAMSTGLDCGLAFLFVLGVGIVNLAPLPFSRTLYRVLAATGLITVLSLPLLIVFKGSEELSGFLRDQIAAGMKIFLQVATPGEGAGFGGAASGEDAAEQLDQVIAMLREGFLRNYVFVYLVFLAGNVRSGTIIGRRSRGEAVSGIWTFRVPDPFIWPLIACGGGVLIGFLTDVGVLRYLFWNGAFIMLFLYGLQGLGILQFLCIRRQVPASLRLLAVFVICLMLFVPRVNLLVYLGIPILGVSEIWIRYRIVERS